MKIEDIDLLLGKICDASGLDEFVVIGSLSALGLVGDGLPPRMTWSMEVDAYPERDPLRAQEFSAQFGENSSFHQAHGYYFDAVSPDLPTLPEGWEQRRLRQVLPCGVKVKYLEPNDCAVLQVRALGTQGQGMDTGRYRGGHFVVADHRVPHAGDAVYG